MTPRAGRLGIATPRCTNCWRVCCKMGRSQSSPAAEFPAHPITGDTKQPGAKGCRIVQPRQRTKGAHPDFLEQVVRIFVPCAEHFADIEPQARGIHAQQFLKGRLVAHLAADHEGLLVSLFKDAHHALVLLSQDRCPARVKKFNQTGNISTRLSRITLRHPRLPLRSTPMNPRYKPLLLAVFAVVGVWLLAWAGMRLAASSRMTPEKLIALLHETDLARLDAAARAKKLQQLADKFRNSELGERAQRASRIEHEFDFSFAVEDIVLRGQIDLWFEEGGELILVDYKTDREESPESYALQLRLYALALEQYVGRRPDRAVLFYLRSERPIEVDLREENDGDVLHRDWYPRGWLDEETVLGQKPGEQHPVPVLVSALVDQPVDGLRASLRIALVAKLASVRPQPVAKLALVHAEMRARLRCANRKPLHGDLGRSLRRPPRLLDGGFQAIPKLGVERGHDQVFSRMTTELKTALRTTLGEA